MNEKIHIGRLIQQKLKDDRRSAAWLAEQIHCDRRNIYKIFGKTDLDTALLKQIGHVMGCNFFKYLVDLEDDGAVNANL